MVFARGFEPVASLPVAFEGDESLRPFRPCDGVGRIDLDGATPMWNRGVQLSKVPEHLGLADLHVRTARLLLGDSGEVRERFAVAVLLREQYGEVEMGLQVIG